MCDWSDNREKEGRKDDIKDGLKGIVSVGEAKLKDRINNQRRVD